MTASNGYNYQNRTQKSSLKSKLMIKNQSSKQLIQSFLFCENFGLSFKEDVLEGASAKASPDEFQKKYEWPSKQHLLVVANKLHVSAVRKGEDSWQLEMSVEELVTAFSGKLVDSRDIIELQLKQLHCEVIIRKKEALEQPAQQVPYPTMPVPYPHAMFSAPPPPTLVAAPAPPALAPTPATAHAKSSPSSHPPLKCPMAGTFYRYPGLGEPPFAKENIEICLSIEVIFV
ncbi:hypothetical protein UlMin_009899 [Ulmus minor]